MKALFIALSVAALSSAVAQSKFTYTPEEQKTLDASRARRAVIAKDTAERKQRCDSGAAAQVAAARERLRNDAPDAAISLLSECRDLSSDSAVKATLAQAEKAASAKREKMARAVEKADLARRKKEGVNIGMSADDVRKSQWGKPERINRTSSAGGVREQWVYPGHHNYLYFENGTLTSIQN